MAEHFEGQGRVNAVLGMSALLVFIISMITTIIPIIGYYMPWFMQSSMIHHTWRASQEQSSWLWQLLGSNTIHSIPHLPSYW